MSYATGHDPNNATDTPDYGVLSLGGWACDDWTTWHAALKTALGKAQADITWTTAWDAQSFWNVDYSFCKYETGFNAYVTKEGLTDATDVVSQSTTGVVNTVTTAVNNIGSAITDSTNVIKYGVPILIGVALLATVVIFARKASKLTASQAGQFLKKHQATKVK